MRIEYSLAVSCGDCDRIDVETCHYTVRSGYIRESYSQVFVNRQVDGGYAAERGVYYGTDIKSGRVGSESDVDGCIRAG